MNLPRWMRRLVGVVAVAVLALLFGPMVIPTDSLKNRAIEKVQAATGRTLTISGPIIIRLLPRPSVSAEGIRLSNPGGDQQGAMVTAYRVVAVPSLSSLIMGHPALDELRVELPEVNLAVDGDGHPNWRFSKPKPASSETTDVAMTAVPSQSEIHAPTAPLPAPQAAPAAVTAAAPPSAPVSSPPPTPAVSAPLDAKPASSVVAEQGQRVRKTMDDIAGQAAKIRLPAFLPVKRVRITNGRVNYRNALKSDDPSKQLQLDGVMLELSAQSLSSPITLAGSALWRDSRWRLGLEMSNLPALFTEEGGHLHGSLAGSMGNLAIDGAASLGPAQPKGSLTIRAEISPQVPSDLLSPGMQKFARTVAASGKQSTFMVRAGFERDRIAVEECAVALGDAVEGNCALTVSLDGPTPAISAKITIDHLNVDRFIKAPRAVEPDPATVDLALDRPEKLGKTFRGKAPTPWKDKALPIDRLQNLDLSLQLLITSALVRQTPVGPLELNLKLKDGQGSLRLNTDIGTGKLSLQTDIDTRQGAKSAVDIRLAAKDLTIDPFLAGTGGLFKAATVGAEGELGSKGDTVRDLIGNLRGNLALSSTRIDLRLHRVAPPWMRALAPRPSACPGVIENAALAGRVAISDGDVEISALTLAGTNFSSTVSGRVDLPNHSLNLRLGQNGQACIPMVRVSGPWSSPSFER